ncbi:MAG: gliding motility protein GldN [Crocinitomicaceae bacterium]|nr:gliding motility protein GldN [Crocinitomicaceae bacterium]
MKRLIFSLMMIFAGAGVFAQPDNSGDIRGPIANPSPGVLDGVYVREHIPTKKVIPYEFVREADVAWSKRVWRVIDLREKFNHPLYYPLDDLRPGDEEGDLVWRKNPTRWSLWTILRYHVFTGDITLYSPFDPDWFAWKDGDQLKYPITPALYGQGPSYNMYTDSVFAKYVKNLEYFGQLDKTSARVAVKSQIDPLMDSIDNNGNVVYYDREFEWYTAEDIVQYRIKEDWYFDNERSVMDVRIIAICPVVYQMEGTSISGFKELFWVYFPECRYVLQNFYVQSRHNDSQRMSFDDLFWKRMFNSYIYKESNIYDRELQNFRAGVEALLEAERIKDKIFKFEHDLWSF